MFNSVCPSISEGHLAFPVSFFFFFFFDFFCVRTSCRYVSLSGMNEKKMRTYTFENVLAASGCDAVGVDWTWISARRAPGR